VGGEDHVAGAEGDAVVGVGGDVVQELVDGGIGCFGGGGLFGADRAEGDEELVVDGAGEVEQGADDALDAANAVLVKGRARVGFHDELAFAAVLDGLALVGRELAFARPGMAIFGQQLGNVAFHREAASAADVVPLEVDAGELRALPILGDVVVFFEDGGEVLCVFAADVFDAEIVND